MRKPRYDLIYKNFKKPKSRIEFANKSFNDIKELLDKRGDWNTGTARIADRLVREIIEYDFSYSAITNAGAIIKGPNGGDVFSFEWSALEKTKAQILKLEEALKLTVQKKIESKKMIQNQRLRIII